MKQIFIDNTLAIRLKQVRKKERYPIAEFAEMLDINPVTYGNYERGIRRMKEDMPKLLSKKFGISEIWFLTGTGQMKSDDKPKGLTSDLRELKEMIVSMQARQKYFENLCLQMMERLNNKGI